MSLNVNRNVTDTFYRYKMPRILAKVEGKGNGIKTVIVNMVEVAKALARPATYTTKYFGCELGAQTQFDFKNDRYIVNGSHDANKLQTLLDGFIKKFVLCPECDNPETTLTVLPKKQVINQVCKACGYRGILDMRHKLTTFILKNPPDVNPAASGSSLATPSKGKSKKRKSEADKLAPTSEDNENSSPHGSENGDEEFGGEVDADDDWSVDVSEEAVKKRMQMLTDGAMGLAINDDLEKTEKERVDILYEFVRKKRDEGCLSGAGKELVNEAERLDIKDKAPLILFELLMDKDILTQIKKYRVLFLPFTHDNKRAQKAVIGGVEQVIQLHQDVLLPKVPHIFKFLYDSDIVEEEVFLDWGKKVSKKYISKELSAQIHTKAEPFLKWLAEAEEEEESSEEEDIEIIIDDRAPKTTMMQETRPPPARLEADEEDLDIDAI